MDSLHLCLSRYTDEINCPSLMPFPINNKEEISQHFLPPSSSHSLHAIFFCLFLDLLSIVLLSNFEKYVCVCVCVCVASVDSKLLVFVYLEMSYNHS